VARDAEAEPGSTEAENGDGGLTTRGGASSRRRGGRRRSASRRLHGSRYQELSLTFPFKHEAAWIADVDGGSHEAPGGTGLEEQRSPAAARAMPAAPAPP
jgi:hypothetical protein